MAIDDSLGELIQSPKSDLPELKRNAEQISVNRLSRIIKILMQTDRDIKQYGYPQIQLEAAFIQLNSLEEGIPLQEIVDKLSELEKKLDSAGISAPQRQQTLPSDSDPPDRQSTSSQTSTPKGQEPPISTQSDLGNDAASRRYEVPTAVPVPPDSSVLPTSPTQETTRELADLPLFWEEIKSKLPRGRVRNGLLDGSIPTVNGTNTVTIACSRSFLPMSGDEDKKMIADVLKQEVGAPVSIELVALDTATGPHIFSRCERQRRTKDTTDTKN